MAASGPAGNSAGNLDGAVGVMIKRTPSLDEPYGWGLAFSSPEIEKIFTISSRQA
jgi:hypothetical protein